MKQPLIGITTFIGKNNQEVPKRFIDVISAEHGVPMLLPEIENEDLIKAQVESIDALLLTGGDDVDPALYNQDPHQKLGNIEPERDEYEWKLIDYALEKGIPVLGICRGSHMLNIHEGGTIYQDIYSQIEDGTELIKHQKNDKKEHFTHKVNIKKGSKMYEIVKQEEIFTISNHHQAVNKVAPGFQVAAKTNDGIVEAIESTEQDFVIGLQWHPEERYHTDESSQNIIRRFVEAAGK